MHPHCQQNPSRNYMDMLNKLGCPSLYLRYLLLTTTKMPHVYIDTLKYLLHRLDNNNYYSIQLPSDDMVVMIIVPEWTL